ncbi:PIR Superfamily Protein [Plasmodium ovale wallikeri]|uniref:PIR Superfamily Protein n=1 Tax=Plasmodium ovale wallikeri TaxID=864142 RepID=A0A1A9A791_PLAOA|nr:PIR Superfamily Protein [Plasmodium ovale wallikeri]SBT55543.1 PIR Superfamily Protein [Plasmodium ovale wallikeri]
MAFSDTTSIRLSDNHYNNLDSRASSRGDDSKCDQLIRELGNEFANDDFRLLCKKITGATIEYEIMPPLINLEKYSCKYFNLWICDRMLQFLKDFKHPKFNDIKNKITEIWETNNLKNTCKWHFISFWNDANYDKIKKLYDYALNYNNLQHHFDIRSNPCTQEYESYIEESLRIYEEVKYKCTSVSDEENLLCTALEDVHSMYENNELSKITCNGKVNVDEIRREVLQSLTQQQEKIPVPAGASQSDDDQSEIENPFQSHESTPEETPSFSYTQKATSVVFPLFGILLSFFLFYKFTPAGTWLHDHLQSKKNVSFNLNEEEAHDLLENTHNTIIENSNTHHLVGYHPS